MVGLCCTLAQESPCGPTGPQPTRRGREGTKRSCCREKAGPGHVSLGSDGSGPAKLKLRRRLRQEPALVHYTTSNLETEPRNGLG